MSAKLNVTVPSVFLCIPSHGWVPRATGPRSLSLACPWSLCRSNCFCRNADPVEGTSTVCARLGWGTFPLTSSVTTHAAEAIAALDASVALHTPVAIGECC